jgi:hypothetical protein
MTNVAVKPITVGYRFEFSLRFTSAAGEAPPGFDLSTAERIRGEFRKSASNEGEPYAVVDSSEGTLSVVDATTISFSIPKEKTALMPAGKPVWVDFARRDAGEWSPIPVQIGWPVRDPITKPPA